MGSPEPRTVVTLARRRVVEQEIKRSRFIAVALRADDAQAALDGLAEVRDPSATHNCWAYRVGDAYRFSDDGEPAGTAGRPILSAIEGQGVDRVMVVVARHFGGVKLGAGGLVRAYGGTAAECLRTAKRVELRPRARLRVAIDFGDVGALYPLAERAGAVKLAERYDENGVIVELELDAAAADALESGLRNATRGNARIERSEEAP